MKQNQVIEIMKKESYLDDRELFVKTQVKQVRRVNPKNPDRPITSTFSAEAYLSVGKDTLYLVQHGMLGKPQKVLFEAPFSDVTVFEITKGPMGLSKDVQIANHEARFQMLVMHKNKEQLEIVQQAVLLKQ
ncbi:MAG: hypothetical protein K9K93_02465 [Acholeplasmataceae bacterium]|nr:hypothetical protein [Acholeplasmataceae bacterium]